MFSTITIIPYKLEFVKRNLEQMFDSGDFLDAMRRVGVFGRKTPPKEIPQTAKAATKSSRSDTSTRRKACITGASPQGETLASLRAQASASPAKRHHLYKELPPQCFSNRLSSPLSASSTLPALTCSSAASSFE